MGERPLSILFTHYGDAWIRGSEQILLNLATGLDRQRFTPIVWCNGGPVAGELRRAGVQVHETEFHSFFGYSSPSFRPSRYFSFVRQGLELVRRHRVGLIHCNGAAPHQWMLPVAWRGGVPVLAHLHADYLRRERFATLLHQATQIAGVSESVVAPLLADGVAAGRCRVIHNGIDFGRLQPGRNMALRARLGIAEDAIVAAAVGSLIPRKGMDLLIRAAAQVPGLHLVIAGDGPEREALARQAAGLGVGGRVHFLGYCGDISPVYAAADIAALASRGEAFGLALAEASYFGLPVVSHRLPGISEAVRDGETGLLVPPGDVEALAAALRRLGEDAEQRRALGAAGRDHVTARFARERMIADFESLYEEMSRRAADRSGRLQPY
ncbi:MAG TPA: glycosyltransferase, partial [Rhizomicrobium sp.]|nr:glycosyltransferase [Rhizomicrobium sp.]